MGKIISIVNQKGGVGKTTTAINLASFLALKGKDVLLIDNDPQGNCTSGVGVDRETLRYTMYDLYVDDVSAQELIRDTIIPKLKIAPSDMDLAGAEIELVMKKDRESVMKRAFADMRSAYDYIIIDCPPSLSLLTVNAFSFSDSMLIPIQCEYFALEGLTQLLSTFEKIKKTINRDLTIEGVLFTMFDGRTNLSLQVVDEVKRHFKYNIFRTLIPRNIRLGEAPSHGLPIALYDKKCLGCVAYEELADEILEGEEAV